MYNILSEGVNRQKTLWNYGADIQATYGVSKCTTEKNLYINHTYIKISKVRAI